MEIHKPGYNYRHKKDFYISRPNGTGDYLFLLIRTNAVANLGDSEQKIKAGSYLLFDKNSPQFYKADNDDYCDDWVHFGAEEAEIQQLVCWGVKLNTPVRVGNSAELSELIRKMSNEFFQNGKLQNEISKRYLELLFLKAAEIKYEQTYHINSSRFDEIRTAIFSTPSNNWKVDNLAKSVFLSRSRFQHLYKQINGTTVTDDIISSRTEYACHLLATTDLSVKSIAEACGYSNDVHFVRQFKSRMKMTPGEYRKIGVPL